MVVAVAVVPDEHPVLVFGYEVSEGFIPQERALFWRQTKRDAAAMLLLRQEVERRDWRDFVAHTAAANFVESELVTDWGQRWAMDEAVAWLAGFDFVGDGDDFELRRFQAVVT